MTRIEVFSFLFAGAAAFAATVQSVVGIAARNDHRVSIKLQAELEACAEVLVKSRKYRVELEKADQLLEMWEKGLLHFGAWEPIEDARSELLGALDRLLLVGSEQIVGRPTEGAVWHLFDMVVSPITSPEVTEQYSSVQSYLERLGFAQSEVRDVCMVFSAARK